MAILTIEMPDELAEQLRNQAKASGEDLNHYAVSALRTFVLEVAQGGRSLLQTATEHIDQDAAEVSKWWESLTPQERAAEVDLTKKSLAAADAGRRRPASEVYRSIRVRFTTAGDNAE